MFTIPPCLPTITSASRIHFRQAASGAPPTAAATAPAAPNTTASLAAATHALPPAAFPFPTSASHALATTAHTVTASAHSLATTACADSSPVAATLPLAVTAAPAAPDTSAATNAALTTRKRKRYWYPGRGWRNKPPLSDIDACLIMLGLPLDGDEDTRERRLEDALAPAPAPAAASVAAPAAAPAAAPVAAPVAARAAASAPGVGAAVVSAVPVAAQVSPSASTPAQSKAALVKARKPGAADPSWLAKYPPKEQYLLRHFGWKVRRVKDGAVGIILAVTGPDITIEWGQRVQSPTPGKRGAHSLISQIANLEEHFQCEVKKGTFELIDPHNESMPMARVLTCGPPCPKCKQHLGVGAEAWFECWGCGLLVPGSHAGTGCRLHKSDPNRYVESNLGDDCSDDGDDSD